MKTNRFDIQRMTRSNTGVGGGGIHQSLAGYATQDWVSENYLSTEWFDKLFKLYNGEETEANKIAPNGALPSDQANLNIEAMFGFWTKKYISALGQGDDGGTTIQTLAQLNDVALTSPTDGQALVYDASTSKWVNGTVQGGTDMATVWAALAANTNEQIASSHLTTALSGYLPLSAGSGSPLIGNLYLNSRLIKRNAISSSLGDLVFGQLNNGDDGIFYNSASNQWFRIQSQSDIAIWASTAGADSYETAPPSLFISHTTQNVGIGTRDALYKLNVNGTFNATTIYQNGTALGDRAFDSTDYLPLSGGIMTGGNITWNSDSHGVYFFGSCGIEKWSGYGPMLVAQGSNTDFWIRNGNDRSVYYKIIHEGNWSSYIGTSSNYVGYATYATTLQTSRNIWGNSFNGSADIGGNMIFTKEESTFAYSGGSYTDPYSGATINFKFGGSLAATSLSTTGVIRRVARSSNFGTLIIGNALGGDDGIFYNSNNDSWFRIQSQSTIMLSATSGASGFASRYDLTIRQSGDIGIGTRYPSYKLHVDGDIYATGGVTALSDIRHKNVVSDVKLTVEQIASMRAIKYYWKDGREDKSLHVGSIAQDWERVMPEVVLRANDAEHTLSLQYGVAALVASIINARKIVSHEKRITDLERECERLRTENERLRLKIA